MKINIIILPQPIIFWRKKMLNDRLYDRSEDDERNVKRQRRLQPATDPFTEQIGVFISPVASKYV